MVDFLSRLSPEQQSKIKWLKEAFEKDKAEFAALSNAELADRLEYYMKNCSFQHQWQPGEPVYDGVVAHVVIPEMIRRLRK